jgi:hypothetical protein
MKTKTVLARIWMGAFWAAIVAGIVFAIGGCAIDAAAIFRADGLRGLLEATGVAGVVVALLCALLLPTIAATRHLDAQKKESDQ